MYTYEGYGRVYHTKVKDNHKSSEQDRKNHEATVFAMVPQVRFATGVRECTTLSQGHPTEMRKPYPQQQKVCIINPLYLKIGYSP